MPSKAEGRCFAPMHDCLTIAIQGVVQGVGFRPFIYNLAREMRINGYVSNTSDGVLIAAEGEGLDLFLKRIEREAPPLARIKKIDITLAETGNYTDFTIRASEDSGSFTLVSPDISLCADCKRELFDREDRRYLYPFINCTNCGPRYSIVTSVPYDRINTTMNIFSMCPQCFSEYHDPGDRRFHAQPNACAACGPQVALLDRAGVVQDCGHAIAEALRMLKQGSIVAVKGLGGFHIACDALNSAAVQRLRELKRKSNKPFALMAPDIDSIRQYCWVSAAEEELLHSPQRPVVLLRKKYGAEMPEAIAPKNGYLGFMLPYTPLHYLLFHHPDTGHPSPIACNLFNALVMTSGNLSEEPILISNDEAVKGLAGIVDAFLVHNRDIFMRVDDSVVAVANGSSAEVSACLPAGAVLREGMPDAGSKPGPAFRFVSDPAFSFIRRSRGYAPEPIPLMSDGPDVLACGADMKNTFALARGKYAIVSQHIGDMENHETMRFFEETLANLKNVYRAEPRVVVHDLHPGYFSSLWAMDHGRQQGLQTIGIQHHHAHIGSVMAEHGLKGKVIGAALDGTGFGTDGSLWGGEFLIADQTGYKRAGNLRPVALPGGAMAVREPWRTTVSYLIDAVGQDVYRYLALAGFMERYGEKKISDIMKISAIKTFSPLSSGAGRLFDAVSALLDICDNNSFEGEASIALEACAEEGVSDEYAVDIHFGDRLEIDCSHTFLGIIDDLGRGERKGVVAAKFHNTITSVIVRVVNKLSLMNNIYTVALSGGVFQNRYLRERVTKQLRSEGLSVYTNETVPCNDGGISLGQVYLAREMMKAGKCS